MLLVEAHNAPAVRLYTRLGFRRAPSCPVRPRERRDAGRFTHVVVRRYQEVWTREVDGVRPPAAGSNEVGTEKITTAAMVKAI